MKTVRLLASLTAIFISSCSIAKAETSIHIIPYPQSAEVLKGSFKASGASVNCDSSLDSKSRKAIMDFADQLTLVTGRTSSFADPAGLAVSVANGKIKGFAFVCDKSLDEEEYNITSGKESVVIRASGFHGFLYAIQTLKQLLPPEIYGRTRNENVKWTIPCVSIKDKPRFSYRGMHLDCSRHFFGLEEVKRYLNIMATYKLNHLHWHLTDDQGWRIEIDKYPLLTQVGGYRKGTCIGKDFDRLDGIRYGGYYTKEQIREIIAYADNLGITIIPEVDLPGHMRAALAAYPQYGCTGGPYEVWTRWGVASEVLCAGKNETYEFLRNILGEVADLFPSEYIHIGGDECPKEEWEKCPDCQEMIRRLGIEDDGKVAAEQYLQNYVMTEMQSFLAGKGKKIIGWDEILEGNPAEGATIMSWRGASGGIEAAGKGFDVIMVPNDYCYIDYYQSEDIEKEPLSIGGYVPVEKVYSLNPTFDMDAETASHVIGAQCNLWTEYIATPEHLEYMLLPRMLALSEVQWCEDGNKDLTRFKKTLVNYEFPVLDILGYTYSKAVLGK